MLRCVSCTAFGLPVDPLENSSTASRPALNALSGARRRISIRNGSSRTRRIIARFSDFVIFFASSSRITMPGFSSQPSLCRNFRLVRIFSIPAREAASSATSAPALKLMTAGVRPAKSTPNIAAAIEVQFGSSTPI